MHHFPRLDPAKYNLVPVMRKRTYSDILRIHQVLAGPLLSIIIILQCPGTLYKRIPKALIRLHIHAVGSGPLLSTNARAHLIWQDLLSPGLKVFYSAFQIKKKLDQDQQKVPQYNSEPRRFWLCWASAKLGQHWTVKHTKRLHSGTWWAMRVCCQSGLCLVLGPIRAIMQLVKKKWRTLTLYVILIKLVLLQMDWKNGIYFIMFLSSKITWLSRSPTVYE